MPNINPGVVFWVSFLVTIAIGVSTGTLVLTNAVPAIYVPAVTAWCGIGAFIGSAFLMALARAGSGTQSRLAAAAAIPEVTNIVTTSAPMANEAGDKVVSTAEVKVTPSTPA